MGSIKLLLNNKTREKFDARLVQIRSDTLQDIADLMQEMDPVYTLTAHWNNGCLRTIKVPVYGCVQKTVSHKDYLLLSFGSKYFLDYKETDLYLIYQDYRLVG